MKEDILVENLSVYYGDNVGLNNINFSVKRGEMVALVGHNGSGKTTLFNTLAGFLSPSTGFIQLGEKIIKNNSFSSIGFSPQSLMIDWYTNVYNNVYLGAQLANLEKKTAKLYTEETIKLLGLDNKKDKGLDELSGGQQQRVQIGRAIVHRPNLYILDEPTVGLDVESANKLLRFLKAESVNNKIVFISSHDLTLLEEYCDKMILLDEGNLLYYGSISEFLRQKSDEKKYNLKVENKQVINKAELDKLKKLGISQFSQDDNLVNVTTTSDVTVTELINILGNYFYIYTLNSEKVSLKEVYLSSREGR